jgi:hypothetical protein
MIDFLYGLDYDDYRSDAKGRPSVNGDNPDEIPTEYEPADADQPTGQNSYSLLINAKAYVIADKYDIQALKEWAVTKYKEVLPITWKSTAFTESARLIYDNTPDNDRMPREVIIRKVSEDVKALFDRSEFIDLL